jgi:hypothetical protein
MDDQIQEAIEKIDEMQKHISVNKLFKGYSGLARITSGIIVFCGTILISTRFIPETENALLFAWGAILFICIVLNYGALAYRSFHSNEIKQNPLIVKHVIEGLPSLFAGGVLTIVLVQAGYYHLLYGMWLLLFGLTNTAYRKTLPKLVFFVGLFYILFGTIVLITGFIPLYSPWALGLIICIGEMAAGNVLIRRTGLEKPSA